MWQSRGQKTEHSFSRTINRRRYFLENFQNQKEHALSSQIKIQAKRKRNARCARQATCSRFPVKEKILSAARIFQNAATVWATSRFCKTRSSVRNVVDFWSSEKEEGIGSWAARTILFASIRRRCRLTAPPYIKTSERRPILRAYNFPRVPCRFSPFHFRDCKVSCFRLPP